MSNTPSEKAAFNIVPSTTGQTQNCIVIPEGTRVTLLQIIEAAAQNMASIDASDEEAGDDEYCVQFPGHDQELLEQDAVLARVRKLFGEGGE
jgi:hypothetical protein